jgi:hypothetical protein
MKTEEKPVIFGNKAVSLALNRDKSGQFYTKSWQFAVQAEGRPTLTFQRFGKTRMK